MACDDSLLAKWEDLATSGICRVPYESIRTRDIVGPRNLIAAHIPSIITTKRATSEFTVEKPGPRWTQKSFDPNGFHFGKVADSEMVGRFGQDRILINISPVGYGHSLLIPDEASYWPQLMTAKALEAAMQWVAHSRLDFRAFFNSLSAWSSVNHLHIQGHCLGPIFGRAGYPIEFAPRSVLAQGVGWTFSEVQWPAASIAVSGPQARNVILALVTHLLAEDVPHNIIFAHDLTVIFPRLPQLLSTLPGNSEPAFRLSSYELAGLVLAETEEGFDTLSEVGFENITAETHPHDWPLLLTALTTAAENHMGQATECLSMPT